VASRGRQIRIGNSRSEKHLEHPLVQIGKELRRARAHFRLTESLCGRLAELSGSSPWPANNRRPSRSNTPIATSGARSRTNCLASSATESGIRFAPTIATGPMTGDDSGIMGRFQCGLREQRNYAVLAPSEARFSSTTNFFPCPDTRKSGATFFWRALRGPSSRSHGTGWPRSARTGPRCRPIGLGDGLA